MPGPLDFAFIAVFAVIYTGWEYFVGWPLMCRAISSGVPRARVRGYQSTLVAQWLFTAAALMLWVGAQRPWKDLWLVVPTGWRLATSGAVLGIVVALALIQFRSVTALSREKRIALRPRLGPLDFVLPHTSEEHRWFMALSVTAGVCEEFLYRGFVVWAFTPALGLYGSAALSAFLFGIGHAYQGPKFGLRAVITGVALGGVALLTGSILPGMVMHAVLDLSGGATGFALLRDEPDPAPVV